MAGTFNLQLVTPEKEIFSGDVEQITVPGSESSFGVLRNHAPIIAALDPGVIKVWLPGGEERRYIVGGGFFQMLDNKAQVLADSAEDPSSVDLNRAQEAEKRARARLSGELDAGMNLQRDRADRALKRARARINATS